MALKLNLAPNELIVLKDEGVAHGGVMSVNDDELILTTLNIIHVKKSMWGNTKGVMYYPLNQLKQAVQGKLSNGTPTLELYFANGVEIFNFGSITNKKIKRWIGAISDIVGNPLSYEDEEDETVVDPDSLAGQLSEIGKQFKEVGDEFRAAFGFKPKAKNGVSKESVKINVSTKVSKKCIGCSAPLVGNSGQMVHCKYCDTDQTL